MISLVKDDFPWIYEIELETYKILKSSTSNEERSKSLKTFEQSLEMLGNPMYMEIFGKSEELYMFSKDMRHFMRRYLDRYYQENLK